MSTRTIHRGMTLAEVQAAIGCRVRYSSPHSTTDEGVIVGAGQHHALVLFDGQTLPVQTGIRLLTLLGEASDVRDGRTR